MAGRPKSQNREEERKNQVVVPMREYQKDMIHKEAKNHGMSNAAFMRSLAAQYFGEKIFWNE